VCNILALSQKEVGRFFKAIKKSEREQKKSFKNILQIEKYAYICSPLEKRSSPCVLKSFLKVIKPM